MMKGDVCLDGGADQYAILPPWLLMIERGFLCIFHIIPLWIAAGGVLAWSNQAWVSDPGEQGNDPAR
jgi:hypothetical protein